MIFSLPGPFRRLLRSKRYTLRSLTLSPLTSTMHLHPYLTFDGQCRQAMTFYRECLGGELFFQTIGESPMADQLPPEAQAFILHASLTNGALTILASDMVAERGLEVGNAVSLMLDCSSEEEIRRLYYLLSDGGQRTHPLEQTFWGALFGNLTDKYGNHWLLHFDSKQSSPSQ